MSYLHYLCLFNSSLPPVVSRRTHDLFTFVFVCRRAHVLFTLFVFVWSSLPPVVSRRTHVLFTLFVFVWFVGGLITSTSSC